MGNMFGATATPSASIPFVTETFVDTVDPEESLDNLAFSSELFANDYQQETPRKEQKYKESPTQQKLMKEESTGYFCDECNTEINERVYGYSLDKFGRPLCMKCQKGAGKRKTAGGYEWKYKEADNGN